MTTTDVHLFEFDEGRIAYRKFGHGPAILLAFHGFDQTGQVYMPLEKQLGGQFTIFTIDLFFHGDSYYTGSRLLAKSDWHKLIAGFLTTNRIERFSLIGFSLGGRFALVTAESFADRIDQLILIAPDGITHNEWYVLATGSLLGRSLFRYGLRHLSILNRFGYALTRLGLLHRTIMRFAEISLNTPEQRKRVYQSWTQFRQLYPNLKIVGNVLNTNPIRIRFFTGAFDRILPGTCILPLIKRIQHYELTILKTGHNRLIDLAAEQIAKE